MKIIRARMVNVDVNTVCLFPLTISTHDLDCGLFNLKKEGLSPVLGQNGYKAHFGSYWIKKFVQGMKLEYAWKGLNEMMCIFSLSS